MVSKSDRTLFALWTISLVLLVVLLIPVKLQATTLITIPDTNLKNMIKPTGDITLEDMENLKKLDLQTISSLEGLQYAKNLEYLSIRNCDIKDISVLGSLTQLNELHIVNCKVSNISALSTLSNLRIVDLKNNQIQDISSLKGLNEINQLILSGNQIKSINALSEMKHLTRLDLSDNQLQDISVIGLIVKNNGFTSDASIDVCTNYFNVGPESPAMDTIKALKTKNLMVAYQIQKWIQVKINDNFLTMDVPPTVINGRTMVPMRAIFEALGATVQYDSQKHTITGIKEDTKLVLTPNVNVAVINGKNVALDAPPTIVNGRTLVPVRLIAEVMGKHVDWKAETNTVLITN